MVDLGKLCEGLTSVEVTSPRFRISGTATSNDDFVQLLDCVMNDHSQRQPRNFNPKDWNCEHGGQWATGPPLVSGTIQDNFSSLEHPKPESKEESEDVEYSHLHVPSPANRPPLGPTLHREPSRLASL